MAKYISLNSLMPGQETSDSYAEAKPLSARLKALISDGSLIHYDADRQLIFDLILLLRPVWPPC